MKGFSTLFRVLICIPLIIYLSGCERNTYQKKALLTSQIDSVDIWIDKARNDQTLSFDSKIDLLNSAFSRSKTNFPDSLKTKKYSQISLALKAAGDTLAFKRVNSELIDLAKSLNDLQAHGEAHWDLGDLYRISKPDSAYYHYKEAYGIFLKADLSESAEDYPGRILFAMALVKNNNKDHVGAEKDIIQAISFYKAKNYDNRLFYAYNELANIQIGLNNIDKALEYYDLSANFIEFRDKKIQFRDSVFNINNRAIAHIKNENYAKGIEYLNQVLAFENIKYRDPESYAKALASLANAKFKNGDIDIEGLKNLLKQSDHVLDSLGNTFYQARNHEFRAELLAFQNDTSQAIKEAQLAKQIADETNNNDRLLSTLQLLTTIDQKNSADHAKAYFKLTDSLQQQERRIRDKFGRIQMETDEVIQENEALAKQSQTWSLVAAILLLFGITIFTLITLRIKNQKLKFEKKQQESNQEIYNLMLAQQGKIQEGKQLEQKRISEEIHDGILGEMLGIRLILSGLNEQHDEAAIAQRAELIDKLQELEEELRSISHELNDASYQKINNFIMAVDDLISNIGASAQLNAEFTHDKSLDWDALDGELKINSYRIVQESIQNCIKHAKCQNIAIDFSAHKDTLKMTITDDGIGFDQNKGKKGIGLRNIISRVNTMSGTLGIDSEIGKGTTVIVEVPIRYQKGTDQKSTIGRNRLQEV